MNIFLKIKDVIAITGLSRSSIYSFIHQGTFPKQVQISSRSVRWLDADIQDWMNSKIERRG